MNLFRIFDRKTGNQFMLSAFDMNAARRLTKKNLGIHRIPKSMWVMPVSQQEIQAMMQAQMDAQMEAQKAAAEANGETPLVDPLNGFKTVEEVGAKVEQLQNEANEIVAEVEAVTAEVKAD